MHGSRKRRHKAQQTLCQRELCSALYVYRARHWRLCQSSFKIICHGSETNVNMKLLGLTTKTIQGRSRIFILPVSRQGALAAMSCSRFSTTPAQRCGYVPLRLYTWMLTAQQQEVEEGKDRGDTEGGKARENQQKQRHKKAKTTCWRGWRSSAMPWMYTVNSAWVT